MCMYTCVCVCVWMSCTQTCVEVIWQLCRVDSLLRLKLRRLGFVAAPSSVRSPSDRFNTLPDVPRVPTSSSSFFFSLLIPVSHLSCGCHCWLTEGSYPGFHEEVLWWNLEKKLVFRFARCRSIVTRELYMCTKRGTLPEPQLSSSVVFLWISTSLLFAFQSNN